MSISLLLVEDEILLAMDIRLSLEKMGYDVVAIAFSGYDAILQATTLKPDVVLMDIKLKGRMDGITAAEQIQKDMGTPIIFVTGNTDKHTMERAMKTNPAGYIQKPYVDQMLNDEIEKAVCKRKRA